MTFLQLCVRLRSLSGITGTGPSAVTGQTGEYERVVNWIIDAWTKIQQEKKGKWKFLRSDFSKNTIASTQDYEFYTADGVKSFDDDSFYIYLPADGVNTKTKLVYLDYKIFRDKFVDVSSEGKPTHICITPDRKLRTYPVSDVVYTILADAYDKPVTLAANGDTPAIEDDFHMTIVYRAIMDYGGYEEADKAYQHAEREYTKMFDEMRWMVTDELEDMVVRPQ